MGGSGIREIKPSGRGELEVTDTIQWLIGRGYTVSHAVVYGYAVDWSKTHKELGDVPRCGLETGMRETVAWYASGAAVQAGTEP